MTATITAPSPAAAAKAVLERADSLTLTDGAKPVIVAAICALRDAIDIHELLCRRHLIWEAYDATLARWPDPHIAAEEQSAKDAEEISWELAEAVEKHMGPEMAEYVSNGITGETS